MKEWCDESVNEVSGVPVLLYHAGVSQFGGYIGDYALFAGAICPSKG